MVYSVLLYALFKFYDWAVKVASFIGLIRSSDKSIFAMLDRVWHTMISFVDDNQILTIFIICGLVYNFVRKQHFKQQEQEFLNFQQEKLANRWVKPAPELDYSESIRRYGYIEMGQTGSETLYDLGVRICYKIGIFKTQEQERKEKLDEERVKEERQYIKQ